MTRVRVWIACGGALLVVAVAGVAWWRAASGTPAPACSPSTVVDRSTAGPDDVLLTEHPWEGTVSARVGQRLVVVLSGPGFGYWRPVEVSGDAVRLLGYAGACSLGPAELAILRADRPGEATLSATTDSGCLHSRPACSVPQMQWRRTVTVQAD